MFPPDTLSRGHASSSSWSIPRLHYLMHKYILIYFFLVSLKLKMFSLLGGVKFNTFTCIHSVKLKMFSVLRDVWNLTPSCAFIMQSLSMRYYNQISTPYHMIKNFLQIIWEKKKENRKKKKLKKGKQLNKIIYPANWRITKVNNKYTRTDVQGKPLRCKQGKLAKQLFHHYYDDLD